MHMEKLIIDYNALSLSRSCDSKVDVFTALTFNTLLEYLNRNKISVNSQKDIRVILIGLLLF